MGKVPTIAGASNGEMLVDVNPGHEKVTLENGECRSMSTGLRKHFRRRKGSASTGMGNSEMGVDASPGHVGLTIKNCECRLGKAPCLYGRRCDQGRGRGSRVYQDKHTCKDNHCEKRRQNNAPTKQCRRTPDGAGGTILFHLSLSMGLPEKWEHISTLLWSR